MIKFKALEVDDLRGRFNPVKNRLQSVSTKFAWNFHLQTADLIYAVFGDSFDFSTCNWRSESGILGICVLTQMKYSENEVDLVYDIVT